MSLVHRVPGDAGGDTIVYHHTGRSDPFPHVVEQILYRLRLGSVKCEMGVLRTRFV